MKLFYLSHVCFFLLSNFGPVGLLALPDGTKTLAGDVSLSQTAKELQITASDGAILEHAVFDIAVDETVRFIQPSSSSRVLNRISAAAPSVIDGKLIANGHVYLVNPAGVLFGENSVVEVGKLHAVAGSLTDQDFINSVDNFTTLSGEVRNAGSITAGEVVLAGSSLTNSGRISAPNGLVLLAVGGGLELSSADGSLSVSLNEENPVGAAFAVGDLAGQALLQSGIIQASRVEMRGSSITHSGSVSATDAKLANFSTFSGSSGSFAVENLTVSGGGDSGDASTLDLSSKANSISGLELDGVFENVTLRSGSSLALGPFAADPQATLEDSFKAQNLDLRVDEGDLTLAVSFSPHTANLDNSLLLAAEETLALSNDLEKYDYLRRIFYGRNLSAGEFSDVTLELGALVSLDAVSVFMDDIQATLSPSVIRSLASDNPGFEGFDSDGLLELSIMSDSQLDLLLKFGLFTGYSYFLQAPSAEAVFAKDLSESGSPASVFGGNYAVLAGGTSSESSSDGDSDEDGDSEEKSEGAAAGAKAASAIPFAPISRPLLSPAAADILDAALSEEVEAMLQKFLQP